MAVWQAALPLAWHRCFPLPFRVSDGGKSLSRFWQKEMLMKPQLLWKVGAAQQWTELQLDSPAPRVASALWGMPSTSLASWWDGEAKRWVGLVSLVNYSILCIVWELTSPISKFRIFRLHLQHAETSLWQHTRFWHPGFVGLLKLPL